MIKIDSFSGEYRWLSNFWPAQVRVYGEQYPSVEHAYQAAKSTIPEVRESIRNMPKAADAKKVGKLITVRDNWTKISLKIMLYLLRQKFKNPSLKQKLIDTGSAEIIEGNWWNDTFWGVCNGIGENNLGKLLMQVRGEINESNARTSK